jgi:hypothetical protein
MPFTVEDFNDLLRLLNERPDWQERLRRVIMPPELFRLPALIDELAEINRAERERVARLEAAQQATRQEVRDGFVETGQRLDLVEGRVGKVESELAAFRTETHERFDRVDKRFDAVDQRFDAVDQRFDVVDQRFNTMDRRFDRTDASLLRVSQDVGNLKGDGTEQKYRNNVAWFRDLLTQPVALSTDEVARFLDNEVAAGRLVQGESRRIERADLILRSAAPQTTAFLVVEVSWLVEERDVRRALDRASLLRKAGYEAGAAVAGQRIEAGARLLADRLGVGRVIDDEREAEDVADDDRL